MAYFEPVPRDGHRQLPNYHKFNSNYYDKLILDSIHHPESREEVGDNLQINSARQWWINKFFVKKNGEINHEFYKLYLKYLTKISSEKYLKSFFNLRKNKIKEINAHIYSDYFFYSHSNGYTWGLYYFKKNDLFHRAKVIRKRLETEIKLISAIIDDNKNLVIDIAYQYNTNNPILRLDNLNISSINCNIAGKDEERIINNPININLTTKIKLDFLNPKNINCTSVKINDEKLNKTYLVKIDNLNSSHVFEEFKLNKKNSYLKFFEKENNVLYLKNNVVQISENLIIPKDMTVIINPGQKLILLNNSFIISNSPWIADGREKEIVISGLENNSGGGIMIKNSTERSYFNNIKFSHLSGYNLNSEFIISGAVNFYKTDVLLEKVLFEKIISEDAINIVNSKFNIKNIKFKESKSDSIDLDFSDGFIHEAMFINIGNDAIDFSGSNVDASNIYFEKIGDKMISVGENSNVNLSNIKANKSFVGIASKDGSIVTASNIKMENVTLPFLSYNKKFEYRPASMYVSDIEVSKFQEKWITDKESKIFFKNSSVGKISKNLVSIVYDKNFELLEKIN